MAGLLFGGVPEAPEPGGQFERAERPVPVTDQRILVERDPFRDRREIALRQRPCTTCGDGRIATTARLVGSMLSPRVRHTLIRASWRARPRGLAHTVIGRPVSRG